MRHPLVSLCAALALLAGSATGHEVEDAQHTKSWSPLRAKFLPFGRQAKATPPGIVLPQYVIALPNRWSVGQEIRVCFIGGDAALRLHILAVAGEWFKHVNLKLAAGGPNGVDCQPASNFEIRIGFDEPGYWSYVGHDSLNATLLMNNLSSMNFEAFDTSPLPDPRFTGIVLHEFGHA